MKLASTCPNCGQDYDQTRVIDSRTNTAGKRRRRECTCGHRFTTLEVQVTTSSRPVALSALLATLKAQHAHGQHLLDAIVELMEADAGTSSRPSTTAPPQSGEPVEQPQGEAVAATA